MMTKKQLKIDLIAIALIIAVAFSLLAIGYRLGEMNAEPTPTTYTLNGVWVDDNTIVTEDGNEWHYLCCDEGYMLRCTVTLDNNNTPNNKTDDEIINVTIKGE